MMTRAQRLAKVHKARPENIRAEPTLAPMFEEDLCLQCGAKPCAPSSVYCSAVCAELDAAPSSPALSPSQSTASSAFPSPSLPPSLGSNYNIPPLALDRAGAAIIASKGRADVWDDSDVAQIESLPHEALHRSVDEMIVSADKEGKSTPRVILRHALT